MGPEVIGALVAGVVGAPVVGAVGAPPLQHGAAVPRPPGAGGSTAAHKWKTYKQQNQAPAAAVAGQGALASPPVPVLPATSLVVPSAVPTGPVGVPPIAVPEVEAVTKKVKVWCWKCSVKTHAVKDCTVRHYCYLCDQDKHPTHRCPTLRLPKPTKMVLGMGHDGTMFNVF